MAAVILLAFIITPIAEIAVFIEVGGAIGLWPTLVVVLATAAIGTWLLRLQGLATLKRAQESLARNQLPINEVFDGLCLLFAGALLLTPGFVTDSFGLALFIPAFRALLRQALRRWLIATGRASLTIDGGGPMGGAHQPAPDDGVIEGEFKELKPKDNTPPGRPLIGKPH